MKLHCILVFNYGVKYHFLSMGSEELSFRTHYFYRKLPYFKRYIIYMKGVILIRKIPYK